MPIGIVLLLLAAACVAAAMVAVRRGGMPKPGERLASPGLQDADLSRDGNCRAKLSRGALRNAAILGAFGLAFVIGARFVESRSTRDTIQQILDKEFPGKTFEVEGVSFPSSYSAPFLARMDLTPSRVNGSFKLSLPTGKEGCRRDSFGFELQPWSVNFLISIPEPELSRIRLCLSP